MPNPFRMTHLESTIALYEEHEIDFHDMFDWHLRHGIVVSCHNGFAFGLYSHHSDPDQPVEIHLADTLFVTICCGNMQKCLAAFQNDFEFIAFQRSFKNSPMVRTYPMDKFIKTLNTISNHGK
jgi:hypothetical protein